MNEPRLSTGFSWKRGFFASQSKGLYDRKAPPKEQATKNLKIHSPLVEKRPHKSQRNFPTCEAVRVSNSLAMDTDPASSLPLNATPVTVFNNATGEFHLQHDSRPPPAKSAGTEPHSALKHDDGQIHRASPIRGLPPENRQLEGQRPALRLQDDLQPQKAEKGSHSKPTGENILVKVKPNFDHDDGPTHRAQPVRGLPLQQQVTDVMEQTQKVAKPTPPSQPPVATSMTTDQSQMLTEPTPFQQPPVAMRSVATVEKPISVAPPPLPSPPDANDGPEAVMRAIDAWFDYQDYLESTQTLSDDGLHPLPVDGERLPEQQSDICQGQKTCTKFVTQPGGQLDGPSAPRKRFSWSRGFLKAHKPPLRWPTPTSRPQLHKCSKHKGPKTQQHTQHCARSSKTYHDRHRTMHRATRLPAAL